MSTHWPNSREFWQGRRVMVTDGAGFLALTSCEGLEERRAATVTVIDKDRCDLRRLAGIRRALNEDRPDVEVHLAPSVGGIGAIRPAVMEQ